MICEKPVRTVLAARVGTVSMLRLAETRTKTRRPPKGGANG